MVIIEITGGLGNQMFQYALYRKFCSLGKNTRLDTSLYQLKKTNRKFELDIFSVPYKKATKTEITQLRGFSYYDNLGDKLKNKIFKKEKREYIEDLDAGCQLKILEMDNVYLSGYWQCEDYFKDIKAEIVKAFTFPVSINENLKKILEFISNTNSVSMHIRRSDYLEKENKKIYGNICNMQYYKKAIMYINEYVDKPIFYIFSDDKKWVKENFKEENMKVIDFDWEGKNYIDMYLMSQCKHNIIANSSFSWWAAWLNKNKNKIVISPACWFNNHKVADVICDSFIKIENSQV